MRIFVFALAALAASAAGCVVTNNDFCCTDADSCTAKAFPMRTCADPSRPFCDNAGAYGDPNVCIRDPATTSCNATEDCLTPQRPVCDLAIDACGACSASADCGRFPARPTCNTSNGACVACLGPSDCPLPAAPVCSSDGVCRGCEADSECPSGVCDEAGGACIAETNVIYVAPTGGGAACTRALPCLTITAGVAAVSGMRRTILVAAGSYQESVVINAKTLSLVGRGADLVPGGLNQPCVDVRGQSSVTIEGLRLHGAGGGLNSDGLHCSDTSTVNILGMTIDENQATGIETINCTVTIASSMVRSNMGGGVSLDSGTYQVRNTFVVLNGGASTGVGGVKLDENTSGLFEFNTIANNLAMPVFAAGVNCSSSMPQTITNNIVVGTSPDQLSSTNCNLTYLLSNEAIAGTGNITGTPMFVTAQDFHLQASSEGVDDADPAAILAVDFDGNARPRGARADIGADEVQ